MYEEAVDEADSRRIAGVLGPTMIVMIASEFPLVQPHLYDAQIPPVVYLSGVLLFVAGLAIVRTHNRWRADWTVLVTLSGVVRPRTRGRARLCGWCVSASIRCRRLPPCSWPLKASSSLADA